MINRLTESETEGIIRLWKKYYNGPPVSRTPEYPGIGCIIIENRIGSRIKGCDWDIAIAIRPDAGSTKTSTYYYSNKELPADIRTALRIAYDIEFNTK